MAKKKSKSKTHKPRAAKAASPPKAKAKANAKANTAGPSSEVESRWNDYWAQRQSLEGAVDRVREAREALEAALAAEKQLRDRFDETKRMLKTLLDVAPADAASGSDGVTVTEGLN